MTREEFYNKQKKRKAQQARRRRQRRRQLVFVATVIIGIFIIISIVVHTNRAKNDLPEENITMTEHPTQTAAPQPAAAIIPPPTTDDPDLLSVIKSSGQKHHVYLTFDDGPNNTVTPQILDILDKHNVKATFFMTGTQIEKSPDICREVISRGHLPAVHSYTHKYEIVYASTQNFLDELNKTYNMIVKNSPDGTEPFKLFRFPGGSFNDSNYGSAKQGYKKVLAEEGFYYADWNCMTGDADHSVSHDGDSLYNYFINNIPDLNNLVVLMHDEASKQCTADMLDRLITYLENDGWVFSRMDEIEIN